MSLTLAMDLGGDECGPYAMSYQRAQPPQPVVVACYPSFANKNLRLKSFDTWSLARPDPEALASAGFFYTGTADKCVCYHCGNGLKDWQETDDPWEEHKKYFQDCVISKLRRPVVPTQAAVEDKIEPGGEPQSSSGYQIPDSLLCKICFENQMCITFLPCRHVATCEPCAVSLNKCAICRTKIDSSMKVHLQ